MLSSIITFFKPPIFDSFELTQKARFLHVSLIVSAVINTSLGVQNLSFESDLDSALFILTGFSFLCIPLVKRGFITHNSIFISSLMFVLITFSLIDGISLQDAGMIAFPIFIIFTSFMISKLAALFTTLLSLCSVILVYILDRQGFLVPSEYSIESQLLVIFVLLIAVGFLLWAIMGNWDR